MQEVLKEVARDETGSPRVALAGGAVAALLM